MFAGSLSRLGFKRWLLFFWISGLMIGPQAVYGQPAEGSPNPGAETSQRLDVQPTETLPIDAWIERAPRQDQSHRFAVPLSPTQRFGLEVEQVGVDVVLELRRPGAEAWVIDSPQDRDGAEVLLLPEDSSGTAELTIRARGPVRPGSHYRLRLVPPAESGDLKEIEIAALHAATEAGRNYALETAGGRGRAAAFWAQAGEAWSRLGRARWTAVSVYNRAVIARLLQKDADAEDLARRVLPLWQELGDAGRVADTLNELGLLASRGGRQAQARDFFQRALASQKADLLRRSASAANLCLTRLREGDLEAGAQCYEAALPEIRSAGDGETEASVLTSLGQVWRLTAQPNRALEAYGQALDLHRSEGREKRVAETLNNLGVLHRGLAEPETAVGYLLEALEIFERFGDRRWQASTSHNLGAVYRRIGDFEAAHVFFERALTLRREVGHRPGEALELRHLGHLARQKGSPTQALDFYARSAAIEQELERPKRLARVWVGMARVLGEDGEPARALDLVNQALSSITGERDREQEAEALLVSGTYLTDLGRFEEAEERLASARRIFEALEDDDGLARWTVASAEARIRAGDLDRGFALLDEALTRFEALRPRISDLDRLAFFLAARRRAYERKIDLLVKRFEETGELRHGASALETSGRARAWGWLELLRQGNGTPLETADGPEGLRWRAARRDFQAAAARRRAALARGEEGPSESEVLRRSAILEAAATDLRRADAAPDALARPEFLDLDGIRDLLDGQTVWLEFSLGETAGFLFAVTLDELRVVRLPGRADLEPEVRRATAELSADGPGEATLGLVDRVLVPIADVLDDDIRRLAWVPDGPFWYLPFAALPFGADGSLVRRFETVYLPSASVLALDRSLHGSRRATKPAAQKTVAVIADPIFERADLRLAPEVEGQSASASSGSGGEFLPRLRSSRAEAQRISGRVSASDRLVALDSQASRRLVMGGTLSDFRYVHLAGHGLIDDRHPGLSGIMLSRFDESGRPIDGFLRLHDIYRLRLDADLVTLAACRTALGKEVRGEGLVGLTRAFFRAGARRVLASGWSVGDRATGELMDRFYGELLSESPDRATTPAAALHRAQRSMAEDPTRPTGDWAGFFLIGDWR